MTDDFSELTPDERLQAENEFLELKLIAEFGADPHSGNSPDRTPPHIKNLFLKHVLEFEMYHSSVKKMPLLQVHNLHSLFPPLSKIPEEKIQETWEKMLKFLRANWINVGSLSPRVTFAELYRFVMEELVKELIPAVPMKGLMLNFIYDEFHPDREYNACTRAQDDCILPLFGVYPLTTRYHIRDEGVWLNHEQLAGADAYTQKVKAFQSRYDQMILQESVIRECEMSKNNCIVKGTYKVILEKAGETKVHHGGWLVTLHDASNDNYWEVGGVGIDLQI